MAQVTIRADASTMFVFPALDPGCEISSGAFADEAALARLRAVDVPRSARAPLGSTTASSRTTRTSSRSRTGVEGLRAFVAREPIAGYTASRDSVRADVDLHAYVREEVRGFFHPAATCAIGRVVDADGTRARLRQSLRRGRVDHADDPAREHEPLDGRGRRAGCRAAARVGPRSARPARRREPAAREHARPLRLPPTLARRPSRRFPVVYMLDGQNLFDDATAHSGVDGASTRRWSSSRAKESRRSSSASRLRPATSAAWSTPARRPRAPRLRRGHRAADRGASFDVDARREATGIAGSSLGGVASLHAVYARPETFGFAGVFSPAFWWTGDDRWFELVEQARRARRADLPRRRRRRDAEDEETRRRYVDGFERMSALLRRQGFDDRSLRTVLERGGAHHETDWARRLPDALRFLLA